MRLNQTLSPSTSSTKKSSSRRGSRASLAATLSTSTPSLNPSKSVVKPITRPNPIGLEKPKDRRSLPARAGPSRPARRSSVSSEYSTTSVSDRLGPPRKRLTKKVPKKAPKLQPQPPPKSSLGKSSYNSKTLGGSFSARNKVKTKTTSTPAFRPYSTLPRVSSIHQQTQKLTP
jgi:hypothetical protein